MSIRERAGRWHYRFQVSGTEFAGSTGLQAIRRNPNAARTIEAQKRLDAEQGFEPEEVSGFSFQVAAAEFLTWYTHVLPDQAKYCAPDFHVIRVPDRVLPRAHRRRYPTNRNRAIQDLAG